MFGCFSGLVLILLKLIIYSMWSKFKAMQIGEIFITFFLLIKVTNVTLRQALLFYHLIFDPTNV